MKVSNTLWIKSMGFNFLALTGLVLFLYALTGDFWRTVLASLLVFLVSHLSRPTGSGGSCGHGIKQLPTLCPSGS